MPQLSPAALEIRTAVLSLWPNGPARNEIISNAWPLEVPVVVAALRAAASALRDAYVNEEYVDSADDFLDDIAAELEGDQSPSENILNPATIET